MPQAQSTEPSRFQQFIYKETTMETRYIKVVGDIAKPLPDHKQDQSTHSIELTDEQYAAYVNPNYFKVVDGEPVAKTQAEVDSFFMELQRENAINQAGALYRQLKANRTITVDSVEYDLNDTFEFDYQRRGNGNIRVKLKNGKTTQKTKQETDAIEAALFTRLNTIADAFDADVDNIEAGDYSLSNLKALES